MIGALELHFTNILLSDLASSLGADLLKLRPNPCVWYSDIQSKLMKVLFKFICGLHDWSTDIMGQLENPSSDMQSPPSQRNTKRRLRRTSSKMDMVAKTSRRLLYRCLLDEIRCISRIRKSTLSR